jgi:exodeoxyribonuclease VII small subunit
MAKNRTKSYQQLKAELDKILEQLEAEDIDIDKSLELYKQGQATAKEIEQYLAKAKAKIRAVKNEQ